MARAFDFVGCEDKGVQLKELGDIILYMTQMSKGELKLALHAGETIWNDDTATPTTTNLKYALQKLEPARIAHGCNLNRDAELLGALKRGVPKVPVEICIISNLLLKYCPLRNHHVTLLESSQHPFVLGTDSPGIQGSSMTDEWVLYALVSNKEYWDEGLLSMTFWRLAERSIDNSFFPAEIKVSMRIRLKKDWEDFFSIITREMDIGTELDQPLNAAVQEARLGGGGGGGVGLAVYILFVGLMRRRRRGLVG
ncbi:unnamed protein product [Polarella glacialis]|uniref:Adenosine deaminase domain-containing protein n=1 Tax=Polarella glacialis TaxID=89957 RepID=A0A813ED64_POLGL|nr:unnamed protein product [Polarella glacialis]